MELPGQDAGSGNDVSRTPSDTVDIPEESSPNGECQGPRKAILLYLMERVPEFRRLSEVRREGWNNPDGDRHFKNQRRNADKPDDRTAKYFYDLMRKEGHEIHRSTDAFRIKDTDQPSILDMCMAPGGYLATALRLNPGARAVGFSLPISRGGHKVLRLRGDPSVRSKFLDITMLAADMGVSAEEIPPEHPDFNNFLPSQFDKKEGRLFNLVLCDGQVLRIHERAAYRKEREACRLTLSQLALGLEHLREGGTMLVLLHKVEEWRTVRLLYTFSKFSSVQLFKPTTGHSNRSSFYMVAADIQVQHAEAVRAVQQWKAMWKVATFGTDETYLEAIDEEQLDVNVVLGEFGEELVRMGRRVWDIQAQALERAPFMKAKNGFHMGA